MLLFYMLVIWQTQAFPYDQLNMYNTDHEQDRYCLLYYVHDFLNYQPTYKPMPGHQVISYCLRPLLSEENFFVADINFNNTNDSMFRFAELKEKNISSQMLLSWSIPIDQIERYEFFLNDRSISSLSSENESLIYNCTGPWFGPLCRFKFDSEFDMLLKDFVPFIFGSKSKLRNITQITCYIHLNCTTINVRCLDWREICDGKIDCIDESDEWNCWQLEMNECAKNEYRCRNGQCIPDKFYHDVPLNPDCLDGTDERYKDSYYPYFCFWDPAFRCEERTCRPGKDEFPCGDGTCTTGISICLNGRDNILLDNLCSLAMACLMKINTQVSTTWCKQFCTNISCITDNCRELYEFPSDPILFGNIRFIFMSKEINFNKFTLPKYICYDRKFYADVFPATTIHDIHFNNLSCHYLEELGLNETKSYDNLIIFAENVRKRFRSYLVFPNKTDHCNNSTMYQCMNSRKCISKHYLIDKIQDCPFGDDETFNQSCSLNDIYHRIPCLVDNNTICFAPLIFQDGKIDCPNEIDELQKEEDFEKNHIYFQTICDGKTDLLPILIDERYETDETECEHWPCNNTYTRCDGYWLCKDGADEVNCPSSTCPQFEHSCVFLNDTSKMSCLPIGRAGNGIIDCLGASDEPHYCQTVNTDFFQYHFRCSNSKKCINEIFLCDKKDQCPLGDDEIFCRNSNPNPLCFNHLISSKGTEIKKFFCYFTKQVWWNWPWPFTIYFKLSDNVLTYPSKLTSKTASFVLPTEIKNQMIQMNSIDNNKYEIEWRCNRGLPIHIRMTNDTFDSYCLCPPSYYGDSCQYQNQRVSLTVQIRATLDLRIVFIFAITLIDNENNIESYDYIKYLPFRDCNIKFHIYLLYSTRPKNLSKNYFVRIDAFNAWTLTYRASWIYPIQFSFLPVYRLAILLSIPPYNIQPLQKCMINCIHGECFNYVNSQNTIFCRCKSGWSGRQCTNKYTCNCAYNSVCISDSICLCSLGRFGSRCHLIQSTCHSQSCYNDGQCIPMDERYIASFLDSSSCICRQEYSGKYCEKHRNQTKLNISFNKKLIIPSFIFIHLITIHHRANINRTTTMKKIAFDQYSVLFDISITFNIVFAEIFDNYYLIIVRQKDIISDYISTEINPSHRCASINELFNTSIINLHLLKRIKYYHLPCKNQYELVCFYDSIHLCLCNLDRQANCFEFDHNVNYNCSVYNLCENGGQCFEDDQKCPTASICACFNCYFGSRCQFSTKDSALSLDIILGYRIRLNQRINKQPIVVKVAIALTTVIFCLGLISNILSFLTFRMKNIRSVGCGLYLFTSSIISMITMFIFIIKFWFLLASQIGSINNRLFIQMQCVSIDFLLRFLLSSGDWLHTCVAIERAVTVWKGVNFNKIKSKRIAKWIILIVILFTICTHIHDPLHRYLSDDEEEQRIWCITKYSSIVQLWDWIINIFHFFVPFLFNCISALVVIITVARVRSNAQKKQRYKQFLLEQFQQHKFLLISPCILIVLALPRLIISFLFECIKSAQDSWFYLISYFISFVPSMLTFLIFVLPSETYKTEFIKLIK